MTPLETVQTLLATVMTDGLEEGFQLFTGMYRAKVTDNKDPKHRGRVKVKMTDFGHESEMNLWITPIFALAGVDRGAFYPPEIGDTVRVVFFAGDRSHPLAYFPGWFIEGALPAEYVHGPDHTPYVRGFITRGGHALLMSDEPGKEYVKLLWHQPDSGDASKSDASKSADRKKGKTSFLSFTKDGGFQLGANNGELTMSYLPKSGGSGQFQILDSYSNNITMDDEGVKIQDTEANMIGMYGGEINIICGKAINVSAPEINFGSGGVSLGSPAVMHAVVGEILLAYLASHVHAGVTPGPGVCGPPVVPPPPSILSKSIKVKQ